MELNEVFNIIEKNLSNTNSELGFKVSDRADDAVSFSGDKGTYRVAYDSKQKVLSFECCYDNDEEYKTVSRSLFELDGATDKDAKSVSNEFQDEIEHLFKSRKKVDLDKVKMPKSVSRTKAKNGIVSYDVDSLANRFGALYPEFKNDIKRNVVAYGEFLPETFFMEIGTPKVIDVIKNGTPEEQKKLFKMLGEVYEDGTNEVQDIIGVTILGEMKNDPEMMAVADKYMTDYMSGPVHEINKLTAKKNRFTKKLANPPAYKPKKKNKFSLANQLNQG